MRRGLNDLDRKLLTMVAERQRVSREVARVKRETGYPTRDYQRERTVIVGARSAAAELGVPPDLAENLMRMLIRSSLTTQEQISVAATGTGSGRRALVIGGSGKMGRWFVDFMASQGFVVDVSDTAGAPPGFTSIPDWHQSDLGQYDYIVAATPLGVTGAILRELALQRPPGIIFDLGSLKSPLRSCHGVEARLHLTCSSKGCAGVYPIRYRFLVNGVTSTKWSLLAIKTRPVTTPRRRPSCSTSSMSFVTWARRSTPSASASTAGFKASRAPSSRVRNIPCWPIHRISPAAPART